MCEVGCSVLQCVAVCCMCVAVCCVCCIVRHQRLLITCLWKKSDGCVVQVGRDGGERGGGKGGRGVDWGLC